MAGASGNVKAGRAFVEIMLDQTKLERGLKQAQTKIRNFGNTLTTAGKSMVTVATIAAAPFAFAAKTFADFDDQMRMVKAVTGATETEFKSLTAVAEKLGRETSFTAKQVADGMTAMGRMGFNAKEIEAAIPAVLNLSRATGTELAEAAEIAANNMRVFGIESSKMADVSDILTATANGSAQTLTDLAEGLKMAGPQAAAAKDSIVNVSGALGVLANMGIKGSLAGTALRKAYSQFAKTDIQDKLKAMGIATVDANGNLRSMPDIMADIAKAMATMPTAKRLGFAEEIFDLRGSLAGLQLGGNIDQLNAFIAKLKSVNGVAAQTALEMDKGIGGAFRRFMSAVEGVQIAIGRIIGDAIAPYMDKISQMLNRMAEWCAAHKEVIIMAVKVIAGVAALGAALIVAGIAVKAMALAVGGLCTVFTILKVVVLAPIAAVKGLIAAFTLLKTVLIGVKVVALATWAAISSPAVLVAVALGVLVAAVWKLTGAWDMCADGVRGLAADFGTAFKAIGEVVGQTWEVIKIVEFHENSYGFRPHRNAHHAVFRCQQLMRAKYTWVIEGDVKACFDEISHAAILKAVREKVMDNKFLDLINRFLKAGVSIKGVVQPTEKGVPQGGVISPLLANAVLNKLDWFIHNKGGHGMNMQYRIKKGLPNIRFTRYADDWCVFITRANKQFAENLKEEIKNFLLDECGLRLSPEKTTITHITDGYDFLGFHLIQQQGQGTRTIPKIKVGQKALTNLRKRLDDAMRWRPQQESIATRMLRGSAVLRGWAEYYRIAHDFTAKAGTFDHWAFWTLVKAISRKLDQSTGKVCAKYYRNGVLQVDETCRLEPISGMSMKMDYSAPERYNPEISVNDSDDEWEADFKKFNETGREGSEDARRAALSRDNYTCQVCGAKLTPQTANADHILPVRKFKSFEAATTLDNLQTLCRKCHVEKHRNAN